MPKGIPGNVLHEYVRNKRGQSVGVLAAVPHHEDGSIVIGWSRASTTKGDRFSKAEGLRIALARSALQRAPLVPYSMVEAYIRFKARCVKYYKDKEVREPFRGEMAGLLNAARLHVLNSMYTQRDADDHVRQLRSHSFNPAVSPLEFE